MRSVDSVKSSPETEVVPVTDIIVDDLEQVWPVIDEEQLILVGQAADANAPNEKQERLQSEVQRIPLARERI